MENTGGNGDVMQSKFSPRGRLLTVEVASWNRSQTVQL